MINSHELIATLTCQSRLHTRLVIDLGLLDRLQLGIGRQTLVCSSGRLFRVDRFPSEQPVETGISTSGSTARRYGRLLARLRNCEFAVSGTAR